MKKSISIFLIISIVVVGAFSLLALEVHSQGGVLCPVAAINGNSGACTPFNDFHNNLAVVFYHLSGMSNFFNIVFGQGTVTLFLLSLFFVVFFAARFFLLAITSSLSIILRMVSMVYEDVISGATQHFLKWIARLNKGDCLFTKMVL